MVGVLRKPTASWTFTLVKNRPKSLQRMFVPRKRENFECDEKDLVDVRGQRSDHTDHIIVLNNRNGIETYYLF